MNEVENQQMDDTTEHEAISIVLDSSIGHLGSVGNKLEHFLERFNHLLPISDSRKSNRTKLNIFNQDFYDYLGSDLEKLSCFMQVLLNRCKVNDVTATFLDFILSSLYLVIKTNMNPNPMFRFIGEISQYEKVMELKVSCNSLYNYIQCTEIDHTICELSVIIQYIIPNLHNISLLPLLSEWQQIYGNVLTNLLNKEHIIDIIRLYFKINNFEQSIHLFQYITRNNVESLILEYIKENPVDPMLDDYICSHGYDSLTDIVRSKKNSFLVKRLINEGKISDLVEFLESQTDFESLINEIESPLLQSHLRSHFHLSNIDDLQKDDLSFIHISDDVNIIFVSCIDQLEELLSISIHHYAIGLDMEWKPVYTKEEHIIPSLLQISYDMITYLIDLYKLLYVEHHFDIFRKVFNKLFGESIVIGFGLSHDIDVLNSSFDQLNIIAPNTIDFHEDRISELISFTGHALNDLCEQYYGCRLNKSEQLSNWENRPLSRSQIDYAALDSHILLHILLKTHDKILSILPFEPLIFLDINHICQNKRYCPYDKTTLSCEVPSIDYFNDYPHLKKFIMKYSILHQFKKITMTSTDTKNYIRSILSNEYEISQDNLIKTLIFSDGTKLYSVICLINDKIDEKILSQQYDAKLKLLDNEMLYINLGYEAGKIPPIGLKVDEALVSGSILSKDSIICYSGIDWTYFACSPLQLIDFTKSTLIHNITKHHSDLHPVKSRDFKFTCDPSLGRLTKWLRVFGFDSVCIKEISDVQDLILKLCVTGRIFLTTNKKITLRKYWNDSFCTYVPTFKLKEQIKFMSERYHIITPPTRVIKRCVQCNNAGITQLDPEQAKQYIPYKTYLKILSKNESAFRCGECHHVFWNGAIYDETLLMLEDI